MDNAIVGLMVAPVIIFMIFVAPIWLFLHYRSKRQVSQGLTDEEYQELHNLAQKAETMAQRISTLESILDHESPHWRSQQ